MPRRRPPQRKHVHREPTYYFVVRMEGEAMDEEVPRCVAEFPCTDSKEMWTSNTPMEALRLARTLSAVPGNEHPYAVYAPIQGESFIRPIGHPFFKDKIIQNGFKHRVQCYDPSDGGWYDVETGLSREEAEELLDQLRDHHDDKSFRLTTKT